MGGAALHGPRAFLSALLVTAHPTTVLGDDHGSPQGRAFTNASQVREPNNLGVRFPRALCQRCRRLLDSMNACCCCHLSLASYVTLAAGKS